MFNSAKLKVQWAELHIQRFKDQLGVFSQYNSHGFRVTENLEGGEHRVDINLGQQPPVNFSLIIADVVHNLRTALDHANWELRGADGGTQDRYTRVPFADNRASYEGFCDRIVTPSGDLPDFFKALELFKDGKGHLLWVLHSLDVEDKHLFLHVTIASLLVQMPQGKSMLNIRVDKARLNPFAPPPVKIHKNTDTSLEICFGDVQGVKFKPVIPTLMHFADAVKQVIRQFEVLVAHRNTRVRGAAG